MTYAEVDEMRGSDIEMIPPESITRPEPHDEERGCSIFSGREEAAIYLRHME